MKRYLCLSILIWSLVHHAGAQPIPIGPPFSVAEGSVDRRNPALALADDGDLVVVWEESADAAESALFGRVFDALGMALGPVFGVARPRSFEPSVVWDGPDTFVIVWGTPDLSREAPSTIRGRRFHQAGVATSGEVVVATGFAYLIEVQIVASPRVSFLGDSYVVFWEGVEFDIRFDPRGWLGMRRIDAAGNLLGAELQLHTYSYGNYFDVPLALARDAQGNTVVAWSGTEVAAQRFNASGHPLGDRILVDASTGGTAAAPAVAMDAAGNFGVVWSRPMNGPARAVYGQRFDPNGAHVGGGQISPSGPGSQDRPVVASDEAGTMTIVWEHHGLLHGRTFDRSNRPLGGEFRVAPNLGPQRNPALASGPWGLLAAAWENPVAGGRIDVLARLAQLADDP